MRGGAVVWITGLPGSGKSTLAGRVVAGARAAGIPAAVLDGDEVREALGRPAGRGEAERDAFYATLASLAALLARQGLAVVVAATAHRARYRDAASALAPRFVEVHVATPAAECERRDPKGLWAGARDGRVPDLPGAGVRYEPPASPDVTAGGGEDAAAVARVVELLRGGRAAVRRAPGGAAPGANEPATIEATAGREDAMRPWSKILCAVDLEETSRPALEHAAALARRLDASLALVHVFTPVRAAGEGVPLAAPVLTRDEEAALSAKLDAARREAERLSGREVRTIVTGGSPAAEVPRIAAREHADLVVVGTHGRTGIGRAVLGSVAEAIVRHAPCAVLVARPDEWGD